MKATRVWRYNCEFCGKKTYSKSAINKHEEHCTMNPNRKCGMCRLIGTDMKPIEELKAIFPSEVIDMLTKTDEDEFYPSLILSQEESEILAVSYLQNLKDATDCCPACVLATLRQLGIHPRSIGYDYQEEVKKFWIEYNEAHREEEFYPY